MARKEVTTVLYTDDLTGEEIPEGEHVTIEFAYGSTGYVIDVHKKNAEKFDDLITPFINAARTVPGSGRKARPVSGRKMNQNLAEIRAWAKENGHKVSDRGRVPLAVVDAYNKANS